MSPLTNPHASGYVSLDEMAKRTITGRATDPQRTMPPMLKLAHQQAEQNTLPEDDQIHPFFD